MKSSKIFFCDAWERNCWWFPLFAEEKNFGFVFLEVLSSFSGLLLLGEISLIVLLSSSALLVSLVGKKMVSPFGGWFILQFFYFKFLRRGFDGDLILVFGWLIFVLKCCEELLEAKTLSIVEDFKDVCEPVFGVVIDLIALSAILLIWLGFFIFAFSASAFDKFFGCFSFIRLLSLGLSFPRCSFSNEFVSVCYVSCLSFLPFFLGSRQIFFWRHFGMVDEKFILTVIDNRW